MSSVKITYQGKTVEKSVTDQTALQIISQQPRGIKIALGPTGPQGPKGDKGDKGDPGTGTAITAENGVWLDGGILKLGTPLTENTSIDGAGKNLEIGTILSLLHTLSLLSDQFFLSSDFVDITNSLNAHIQFDSGGFKILNTDSAFFGLFRISNGTEGGGKVLTSDINGNATWEDPAAGTNQIDMGEATNADFAMVANGSIHLPRGILSADRTITIPVGVFPNTMEIYCDEETYVWKLVGEDILLGDETPITQLDANTNYMIKFKSGKWRIRN